MQNSDISAADPAAKRVGQACNLRRYQVSDKVLFCRGKVGFMFLQSYYYLSLYISVHLIYPFILSFSKLSVVACGKPSITAISCDLGCGLHQ